MSEKMPLYLEDTVFRLQLAGYQVVLAHPERYGFVQRDPASLDTLVERGVALQLTAPALLGEYGSAIRRTSEKLLSRGHYQMAASDRHHPGADRSLMATHTRITELAGEDQADLLLRRTRTVAGRPGSARSSDAVGGGNTFLVPAAAEAVRLSGLPSSSKGQQALQLGFHLWTLGPHPVYLDLVLIERTHDDASAGTLRPQHGQGPIVGRFVTSAITRSTVFAGAARCSLQVRREIS
jgi:hypothetical protein